MKLVIPQETELFSMVHKNVSISFNPDLFILLDLELFTHLHYCTQLYVYNERQNIFSLCRFIADIISPQIIVGVVFLLFILSFCNYFSVWYDHHNWSVNSLCNDWHVW